MTAKAKADSNVSRDIAFENNGTAQMLFGAHNAHLSQIEEALGLDIVARGASLCLTGNKNSAQRGHGILSQLYQRLERGAEVGPAEVAAALRMTDAATGDQTTVDMEIHTKKRVISPRSPNQAAYLKAIDENELVFGCGPAGTGKTYLAVAKAVERLINGDVDRIILTRPAVEAGEQLGFLPGDMKEKVDPYLRPLYDALHDMMPDDQVAKRLESGNIEVAPLAFMRGRTLSNAFVILDEAQNTTAVQMKMFLTRLGENSRMVVTGDLSQVDLPRGIRSGLRDALDILSGVKGVAAMEFTAVDVIRHKVVARIVKAYDKAEAERKLAAPYEPSP